MDSSKPDPCTPLGVRPFINRCGTRTVHGGSIMVPAAQRAMQDAAHRFVNINELMEGVGRRLAEPPRVTKPQGAPVSSARRREVWLSCRCQFKGTNLSCTVSGHVTDGTMAGTVLLGSTGNSAPGPLNEREYGEGTWRATCRS